MPRHAIRVSNLGRHSVGSRESGGAFSPLGREIFVDIDEKWYRILGRAKFHGGRVRYPVEQVHDDDLVAWLGKPAPDNAEEWSAQHLFEYVVVLEAQRAFVQVADIAASRGDDSSLSERDREFLLQVASELRAAAEQLEIADDTLDVFLEVLRDTDDYVKAALAAKETIKIGGKEVLKSVEKALPAELQVCVDGLEIVAYTAEMERLKARFQEMQYGVILR